MGWLSNTAKVGSAAAKGGGAFWKVRVGFLMVFVYVLLANAAFLSYEARDLNPGLEYLGGKIVLPTLQLREVSQQIIADQGIKTEHDGIRGFFEKSLVVSDLGSSLIAVYIWLWVFAKFAAVSISDTSNIGRNWTLAFLGVFAIHAVFLANNDQDFMTLIWAFRDFFVAVTYIMPGLSDLADKFVQKADFGLIGALVYG